MNIISIILYKKTFIENYKYNDINSTIRYDAREPWLT